MAQEVPGGLTMSLDGFIATGDATHLRYHIAR